MATDKNGKTAEAADIEPSSAPELSDEQKRSIEESLTVESAAELKRPAPGIGVDGMTSAVSRDSDANISSASSAVDKDVTAGGGNPLKRLFGRYWRHKKWTVPLTALALFAVVAAVPASRYALAAYVVKQQVAVSVMDSATKKPVSSADVSLDGKTYKTDKDGKTIIKDVRVGNRKLTISKKYYKSTDQTVLVPINKSASVDMQMVATGRQVPVSVVNKISGKPLENTTLKSVGTEVKTDKDGKAVIVLPADKEDLPITVGSDGYNGLEARVKVTDQEIKENSFALTPNGKLYFLSRQSGKIDVVKTDLDGGNRQTVVSGTGKEDERGTVLLASRDWKYLALLSRRDSGLARLYVVDTSNDKMSEMDAGNASFSLVGWQDHDFVYKVTRKTNFYDPNQVAIKSYNADKKQILTIDQTAAVTDGDTRY